MPAIYRCDACNATWSEDREPDGCPKCGSRSVTRQSQADPYLPPGTAISDAPRIGGTSFAICYWMGWLGVIAGCGIIGVGAVQAAQLQAQNPQAQPDLVLFGVGGMVAFVGGIGLLAAIIIALVKLYRGWEAIQPLRRIDPAEADMPSPGKAIGLLFVPFWNVYWMFVAFRGLTVRANAYMARLGVGGKPMSVGLPTTYCVLTLCAIIPFLGFFFALANIVIYFLYILDVDRMRRQVASARGAGPKMAPGVDFAPL